MPSCLQVYAAIAACVCGGSGISTDGTSHSDAASVPVVAALPAGQLQHRQQSQWKRRTVSEDG